MFEKVVEGDRRRRQQRNRNALAVSMMAHAVLAAGAAHLPLRAVPTGAAVEEVVSFVDLAVPDRPEVAARPEHAAGAAAARAPTRAAASADHVLAALPHAAAPAEVPDRLPSLELGAGVVRAFAPGGILRLRRLASAVSDDAGSGMAEGDVVEADVLAERPRLANRVQMERVWKRLYPRPLEMRGVIGDAVVSFVIDEQGRVVPESVQLVSSSRDEFGEAALAGVPLLRFRPMRVGGVPVRVRTTLPVLWRLPAA